MHSVHTSLSSHAARAPRGRALVAALCAGALLLPAGLALVDPAIGLSVQPLAALIVVFDLGYVGFGLMALGAALGAVTDARSAWEVALDADADRA